MLTLITAPASDPVSISEMKAHLRIDHSDEDATLAGYLRTATGRLDGQSGLLGRALVSQTWRLTLEAFPIEITLPLPPCQSVTSIEYLDLAGDEQTLSTSGYRVFGLGGTDRAVIRPAVGAEWPETAELPGAVVVTFVAGYGDAAAVPEPIRHAVLQIAAGLYSGREDAPIPRGVADDLSAYRAWQF